MIQTTVTKSNQHLHSFLQVCTFICTITMSLIFSLSHLSLCITCDSGKKYSSIINILLKMCTDSSCIISFNLKLTLFSDGSKIHKWGSNTPSYFVKRGPLTYTGRTLPGNVPFGIVREAYGCTTCNSMRHSLKNFRECRKAAPEIHHYLLDFCVNIQ